MTRKASLDLRFTKNPSDKIPLVESSIFSRPIALGPAFESPAISSAIKGVRRAVWFFGALSSMAWFPPMAEQHVHEIHDGWTRVRVPLATHTRDRERVHESVVSRVSRTLSRFYLSCVFPLSAWPLIGHIWVPFRAPRPPIPSGYSNEEGNANLAFDSHAFFAGILFLFLLSLNFFLNSRERARNEILR